MEFVAHLSISMMNTVRFDLIESTILKGLGARTLLGAPGIATRNKKLLRAPGLTTRSKDATRGSKLDAYKPH